MLTAKDLDLNQSTLTGESIPVDKSAAPADVANKNPLGLASICFLGSNIESGTATGVLVLTGKDTYFGSLASRVVGQRELTSFDLGIEPVVSHVVFI